MVVRWSLDSSEMRELIEKVAVWPHGLGFLHLADVETVATVLHVHPFLIDRARDAIQTPEGRKELIRLVREARERLSARPDPESLCAPHAACHPPEPQKTAEELIEAAREHTLGLAFLKEGHPEAIAVVFQVHPDTVFEARERLEHEENEHGNLRR
jgi:hypothetical protein